MLYKRLFLLFLFFLLISSANSQQFSWFERISPVTTSLNCVDGIGFSPTYFWMCGINGVVLKTRDYGLTVTNQTGNGIPTNITLTSVAVFDTGTAVTGGFRNDTAFMYRTSNGGANWSMVFYQKSGMINAITRKNITYGTSGPVGFMAGNPVAGRWSLWRTTNSGATWDSSGMFLPQASSETGYNNSIAYIDTMVWFGTNNARMYRSSNEGSAWITSLISAETGPSSIISKFWYSGIYTLTFGGTQSIQSSSNSGSTWFIEPGTPGGSGRIPAMVAHDGGVNDFFYADYWYTRNDTKVYHYGFGTWSAQYIAPAGNFTDISQANQNTYFIAVRDNGGIAYCNCQIWGGVSNLGGEVPRDITLKQNYPNPFNPSTTINFSIPGTSAVTIKIYNSLGTEVGVLLDRNLTTGNYEVTWDAAEYASGIYYYRLLTPENTKTGKMVLVK